MHKAQILAFGEIGVVFEAVTSRSGIASPTCSQMLGPLAHCKDLRTQTKQVY